MENRAHAPVFDTGRRLRPPTEQRRTFIMDANEFTTGEGSCIISEDVIAQIAATAAAEVPGVAGMADRPADLRGLMSVAAPRCVKVTNTDTDTVLDVYVILRQGTRIQEAAMQVQHDVKVAVQAMTGKPVTRVNVHVAGMAAAEDKAAPQTEANG